jgi:sterol desaturase/sphingolipid hydroxylase (fatty acid hydroxylase superfamily)
MGSGRARHCPRRQALSRLAAFSAKSPQVIVLLLVSALRNASGAGFTLYITFGVLFGMFLWTFAEYTLHRFVFHYHAASPRMKRVVFLFHGIHHAQPQCKTRLVMPPAVSIPMAFVGYGLFYLLVGVFIGLPDWVDPLCAGFLAGYLIYDLIHYATHHYPMRWGVLKLLKRYHMQHHYKTPDKRFGVSSPLWDKVFNTNPG